MKVYEVIHIFDVDGGFGDAIPESKIIVTFDNRIDAEIFVEKYNNPHIYDVPYDELWEGELEIQERNVVCHADFESVLADEKWDYVVGRKSREDYEF